MKTCAHFEEAADAAMNFCPTRSGPRDARKNLEERGFAGTVAANQPQHFAFTDLQRDIVQRPEGIGFLPLKHGPGRTQRAREGVAKKFRRRTRAPLVALTDTVGFDDGGGHTGCLTVRRLPSAKDLIPEKFPRQLF